MTTRDEVLVAVGLFFGTIYCVVLVAVHIRKDKEFEWALIATPFSIAFMAYAAISVFMLGGTTWLAWIQMWVGAIISLMHLFRMFPSDEEIDEMDSEGGKSEPCHPCPVPQWLSTPTLVWWVSAMIVAHVLWWKHFM